MKKNHAWALVPNNRALTKQNLYENVRILICPTRAQARNARLSLEKVVKVWIETPWPLTYFKIVMPPRPGQDR